MSDEQVDIKTEHDKREATSKATSLDVQKTLDHLRNNRTTETEARNLEEATRRSQVDHKANKSFGRL